MNAKNTVDPFGLAVTDYYNSFWKSGKYISVNSSVAEKEKIKVSHLFRNYKKMPKLEQEALGLCRGKVLDVGACAGSHALELQSNGLDITALEISSACCDIMYKRGVKKVVCSDIFKYSEAQYDTILLLMNGIGLAGNITRLRTLLAHLKTLLKPEGQIIFDSSDIDYIYYEDDGSKWMDLNNDYHGQVDYTMSYKKQTGPSFEWLFIDVDKMKEIAEEEGFQFTILAEGDHYDYLGLLKPLL